MGDVVIFVVFWMIVFDCFVFRVFVVGCLLFEIGCLFFRVKLLVLFLLESCGDY